LVEFCSVAHIFQVLGGTDAFVLGGFLYLLWDAEGQILEAADQKQPIAARRTQEAEVFLLEAIALKNVSLGSHCAEKRVAIKQSKLSFDRCSVNFFGIVLRSCYPTLFVQCVLN